MFDPVYDFLQNVDKASLFFVACFFYLFSFEFFSFGKIYFHMDIQVLM